MQAMTRVHCIGMTRVHCIQCNQSLQSIHSSAPAYLNNPYERAENRIRACRAPRFSFSRPLSLCMFLSLSVCSSLSGRQEIKSSLYFSTFISLQVCVCDEEIIG
mmetsp:Transcript_19761/g.29028  ORF Transcript_19761/g.29028 Transcript_19761/m.29028 type:complete len:104 (+) Transcript_19761:478-789(+)